MHATNSPQVSLAALGPPEKHPRPAATRETRPLCSYRYPSALGQVHPAEYSLCYPLIKYKGYYKGNE